MMALIMVAPPYARAGIFDLKPAKSRFYVGGYVGGSFLNTPDIPLDFSGVASIGNTITVEELISTPFDDSLTFGGSIGAQLPFKYLKVLQPRLELEIGYFKSETAFLDASDFEDETTAPGSITGDQTALVFYFNNYSDIRFTDNQILVPYFGGGIGFVDLNGDRLRGLFIGDTFDEIPSGSLISDRAFSGHIAGGLTLNVNNNAEFYGEARYFRFQNVKFETSEEGDTDIDGFTLTAGFRWKF